MKGGSDFPPLRGLLPLAVVLAVWQLVQSGPSPILPPPSDWWRAGVRLFASERLLQAMGASLWIFAASMAFATVLGVLLGLVIGTSRPLNRALSPTLEFLRSIPPAAIVPVAVLLLGYREGMNVAVVTLAVVWPILLNVSSAAASVHPVLLDVGRSLRMRPAERYRKIVLPAVVPAILLGIRVALPLAIVVTLVVEMLTSLFGVGSLMVAAQRNFQAAHVFALLVVVGVMGLAINAAFVMLESRLMRSRPPRFHR